MNPEVTTYYVIDSVQIAESNKDQAVYHSLFAFEKDTSLFFTKDKLEARYGVVTTKAQAEGGHEGVTKIFTLEQDDGVLALLVLCFLFFTRIFKGGFTFFKENIRLLFFDEREFKLIQ